MITLHNVQLQIYKYSFPWKDCKHQSLITSTAAAIQSQNSMEEAISVSYKPTGTFLLLQWGTIRKRKGEISLTEGGKVFKPEITHSRNSCWPCWLWLSSTQLVFSLVENKIKLILLSKLPGTKWEPEMSLCSQGQEGDWAELGLSLWMALSLFSCSCIPSRMLNNGGKIIYDFFSLGKSEWWLQETWTANVGQGKALDPQLGWRREQRPPLFLYKPQWWNAGSLIHFLQ